MRARILKGDGEMNYEDPKRRAWMSDEVPKRRTRRKNVAEDFDADNYMDDGGDEFQDEDNVKLPNDESSVETPAPNMIRKRK
jgi:hypothetical protein